MMRLMIRFLLALAALFACAAPASAAERRYAVADFERVVVEGPYSVRLTVGRSTSALATGSQQALDAVTVEVQGTTLRIRRNANAWSNNARRPAEPAVIVLTTRTLRSARLLGAGRLDIDGAKGLRLDLIVEGSGRLSATRVDADNLSLGLRGSASIEIAGTAETLTADIQGASSLAGSRFSAETATISASTAGEISLTARRAATVTANGLGKVTIQGSPACTLRGPAAGDVSCGSAR